MQKILILSEKAEFPPEFDPHEHVSKKPNTIRKERVVIKCVGPMWDDILDEFGLDVKLVEYDEYSFTATFKAFHDDVWALCVK